MSHDVTLLKIDTDKPAEVQAVMLYGIRAGLETQRSRDTRLRAEADADQRLAAARYHAAETFRDDGDRFYLSGIVLFIAAFATFVAAYIVGVE